MTVLPGPRPRPDLKSIRTRGLVRRVTPLLAIVTVIAVQAGADLKAVLVFPLYLGVVLLSALYLSRSDSLAAAVLAATTRAVASSSAAAPSPEALRVTMAGARVPIAATAVHEVV